MLSAAEIELASLFITASKCAWIRQTLTEIGWPQRPSPSKAYNNTTLGVIDDDYILNKLKSWSCDYDRFAADLTKNNLEHACPLKK